MKFKEIKSLVENSKPTPIGVKHKYSVFIPLIEVKQDLHLLYEIRSRKLKSQPGEICFPGGRIEENEGRVEAAIRETCEELLITSKDIELYGEGDYLVNPYGAILYSAIGKLNVDFDDINPSIDEVDSVFTIPLNYLLENPPKSYEVEFKANRNKYFPYELIPNGENYNFKQSRDDVLFYRYENLIIWGFTAKMTSNFINKIKKNL